MKHFLIIKNSDKDKEFEKTNQICSYIEQAGGTAQVVERSLDEMRGALSIAKDCECVIVLGGDGSILRTVRAFYEKEMPVVGVNFGNLGFLTEVEPEDVTELLDRLLKDEVRLEKRMLLEGTVYHEGQQVYSDIALNDIVVGRRGLSRIIRLKIEVNGELVNIYDADGIVVSTPTGSTAYNLSAGGPVVAPQTNMVVVTPISPHSLSARSLVLSGEDEITITVEKVRVAPEIAVATFDGQTGQEMIPADTIVIKKSSHQAKLVRSIHSNFYEVLREKMK